MNSSLINLTPKQLRHAASIKQKIESLQNRLMRILEASNSAFASDVAPKKRRKMSAAARRKISLAAKTRWAKAKAKGRTSL